MEFGEASEPRLEVAQQDVKEFSGRVKKLVGRREFSKEYPTTVDGQDKIVELTRAKSGPYATMRIRDTSPEGDSKSFPYEQIIVTEGGDKLNLTYRIGALEQREDGSLYDQQNAIGEDFASAEKIVTGIALAKRIDGEPIDEFRKMQSVLEGIEAKQTPKNRIKNLLNRRNNQ